MRRAHDRELELVGLEAAQQLRERRLVDGELDARIRRAEAREETGELRRPDRRHGAHAQRRLLEQAEIARDILRASRLGEHLLQVRAHAAAELGDDHALAFAVQQRRADVGLELLDGGGHRRLGYLARLGGARDAAVLAYREEVPDLMELHGISRVSPSVQSTLSGAAARLMNA